MTNEQNIAAYIDSQTAAKRAGLKALHERILQLFPNKKLWFLSGVDDAGKIVSNPNIGYGEYNISYKDGSSKPFYRVGISANTKGISVYLMGLEDKNYLPNHFGKTIGKAKVTGYCISFKSLNEIDITVLEEAIKYALSLPE